MPLVFNAPTHPRGPTNDPCSGSPDTCPCSTVSLVVPRTACLTTFLCFSLPAFSAPLEFHLHHAAVASCVHSSLLVFFERHRYTISSLFKTRVDVYLSETSSPPLLHPLSFHSSRIAILRNIGIDLTRTDVRTFIAKQALRRSLHTS